MKKAKAILVNCIVENNFTLLLVYEFAINKFKDCKTEVAKQMINKRLPERLIILFILPANFLSALMSLLLRVAYSFHHV